MKNKFRYLRIILENALIYNPILIQIIGLCPVIAIATTLKNAVAVALSSAVLVIVMETLASAFMKKIVRYIRVAIYFIVSVILLAPILILFENQPDELMRDMSIILPLLAVSSFVVVRCEKFAVKNSVKASVVDSLASAVGYGVVVIISGLIREIFGKGSIWGVSLFEQPPLAGLAQPFGGFVILGFLATFLSMIVAKFFPQYSEDIIFRFKTPTSKYNITVYNPDKEREEAAEAEKKNEPEVPVYIKEEELETQEDEAPEIDDTQVKAEEEPEKEDYFGQSRNEIAEDLFSKSLEDILGDILNKNKTDEQGDEN